VRRTRSQEKQYAIDAAKQFSDDHSVNLRLQELAVLEAAIIEEGCELPRVHS
jgi:tRNA isopentenyl-2-thiomethyl-A-37 hydroxylase MiaE